MGRRKKWKLDLLSGQAAALMLLGVLFLVGSVAGCICAGLIDDSGGALLDYVSGYLDLLARNGVSGHFLSVLWETIRFPLAALLLGFTALGVVGLPVLFLARGFLLCYAVSAFYRLLGPTGLVPAFFLFGLSAMIWLPVLFQFGVQGVLGSYGMLRRSLGDGRYPLRYSSAFWVRCGLCAAALCLCAWVEYLAVPMLLQGMNGVFLPG